MRVGCINIILMILKETRSKKESNTDGEFVYIEILYDAYHLTKAPIIRLPFT